MAALLRLLPATVVAGSWRYNGCACCWGWRCGLLPAVEAGAGVAGVPVAAVCCCCGLTLLYCCLLLG